MSVLSARSSSASSYPLPSSSSGHSGSSEHEPFTEETCCVKLHKVGRSSEQVRGMAAWIFHHRTHLARIAKLWLSMIKRAPPGRRLTLYYVAYETLGICKKKKFDKGFPCFQGVLREATVYCRDRECKAGVRKVLGIFKEAQFFSEDFLKQLREDLEKGRSASNHNKVVLLDFEPGVISKIHEQMNDFHEGTLKTAERRYKEKEADLAVGDDVIGKIKEHGVGKEHLSRFDAAFQRMRDLEEAREQDLKQSYDLLSQLELLRIFYSTTSKEAEKVIVAYGNYERVAQNGMTHLDKAQRLLSIPLPNLAPAEPEADVVDMELSDDEDETKKPVGFLGDRVETPVEVKRETVPIDIANPTSFAALLSSLPVAPPMAPQLPSIPVQHHPALLPIPPPLPPYAFQQPSPPKFFERDTFDEFEEDSPLEPMSTPSSTGAYDMKPPLHVEYMDAYPYQEDYRRSEQRPPLLESSPLRETFSPPRHPSLLGPPPPRPMFAQHAHLERYAPRFPGVPNGRPPLLNPHTSPQIRQTGQYIQYIPAQAVSSPPPRMPLLTSPDGPPSPSFDQDHHNPRTFEQHGPPDHHNARGRRGFGRPGGEGRGRGRGNGGQNGRMESEAAAPGAYSIPSVVMGGSQPQTPRGRGAPMPRGREKRGRGAAPPTPGWNPSRPPHPLHNDHVDNGEWFPGSLCAGTGSNLIPVVSVRLPAAGPVGESVTERLLRLASMK